MNDPIHDILGQVYGGRRWLVAADVLQAAGAMCRRLREWGAEDCFALAGRVGTGDLPGPEICAWRSLDLPAAGMMESIHSSERAFRALPAEVQAEIERFDPDRRAEALGVFFSNGQPIGGRRFFGARPPEWQRLEDKTVIDAVWDAAGVPRAPTEVVSVRRGELVAAARRLDRGMGTVWVGDMRDGFHGGAALLRWIRLAREGDEAVDEAVALLSAHCDRARVMPFLDGIPCSVHGVVFPGHVVVLRPAEMLVLRGPGATLRYGRAATFWDPLPADREAMRATARRVGEHLRESVGYRGAFTIDGVMTAEGFLPTELNPRPGAALGLMGDGFPFDFVHYALIEGVEADWRPVELEARLLATSDANRQGRPALIFDRPVRQTTDVALVWEGDGWRSARSDEAPHARGQIGPGPSGGFLSVRLEPEHTPVGPSVAPRAAALARWASETFGLGIEPLEPAPDVRAGLGA